MQASTSRLNRQFHRLKNGLASTSKAFNAEEKVKLRALERIGAKRRWERMTPAQRKIYEEEKARRTQPEDPAQYLQYLSNEFQTTQSTPKDAEQQSQPAYFDLGSFNQIFDVHPDLYSNPTDGVRTVQINDPAAPMLSKPSASEIASIEAASSSAAGMEAEGDTLAALAADASNPFTLQQLRQLHRYPLVLNRVVNMTSKGKIPSMYALVVVGNGNGLVGFGEGKSENAQQANDRAFVQAIKSMDYVQRKDARTTWADLMKGKWCATTVELRSRPPGFGLRTGPIIHQIAKASGILDLSAKVRGSRNSMNTVKATINLLHGGAAPLGLGDLSGKDKLARRFKGVGMRSATEVGLDLGRKAVELRIKYLPCLRLHNSGPSFK